MKLNQKTIKHNWIKPICIHLLLTALSAVLFALSFPNPLFKYGIPFLAWFAYIPVLLVIQKNSLLPSMGWGAVYALLSYSLFNYWLGEFHPVAGLVVYSIFIVYLAFVFFLLKASEILFPKNPYIVQWLIWLSYEYLRTLGFLGYSYGVTGYSQWRMISLIQIARITGVWGVSALVTFPSFWLAHLLKGRRIKDIFDDIKKLRFNIESFFNKKNIPAIIWVVVFLAAMIFGITSEKDFSAYKTARIALVQHNTDPWEAEKSSTMYQVYEAYKNDLSILKRLSDEALASPPKPQLVVWPETAFVPRIYWYMTYRDNQNSWVLVNDLLSYLAKKDVPFLIGNDDGRMDPEKNPDPNKKFLIDYNAALFMEKGVIKQVYRKLHLVPFTEHFPYKKQLPFIYKYLQGSDIHFWEKGDEETVFEGPGFKFSTPICFEDTFGNLSRNFVRSGAEILINISNDAWAKSLPAQNQHLSMAVFRAVENKRPMVRSTASGQTCAVFPNGKVVSCAREFTESWLNVSMPLLTGSTIYTQYGDYLAILFVFTAILLLLFALARYIMNKLKRRH